MGANTQDIRREGKEGGPGKQEICHPRPRREGDRAPEVKPTGLKGPPPPEPPLICPPHLRVQPYGPHGAAGRKAGRSARCPPAPPGIPTAAQAGTDPPAGKPRLRAPGVAVKK